MRCCFNSTAAVWYFVRGPCASTKLQHSPETQVCQEPRPSPQGEATTRKLSTFHGEDTGHLGQKCLRDACANKLVYLIVLWSCLKVLESLPGLSVFIHIYSSLRRLWLLSLGIAPTSFFRLTFCINVSILLLFRSLCLSVFSLLFSSSLSPLIYISISFLSLISSACCPSLRLASHMPPDHPQTKPGATATSTMID